VERFVDPTLGYPHGEERGYARGCRCLDCTAAHTQRNRDVRAAKKAREATQPKHVRGQLEKTVRRELKNNSDCSPPWVETLHALAVLLAQQIDRAHDDGGKESVISPLTARLYQTLDRIRVAAPAKGSQSPAGVGDEAEDFVNGLTPMG
jgi:hypothetical protein